MKPSSMESTAYYDHMDIQSLLGNSATPLGLPLVTVLPLRLMPSLPGLRVLLGRFVVVSCCSAFHDNGL